jgi:hypothetical protein
MITLKDLWNTLLIETGQFILQDKDIEIDTFRFKTLVNRVLALYSKYCPHLKNLWIMVNTRKYTFIDPPEWIMDLIPLELAGIVPYFIRDPWYMEQDKRLFIWEYRKPNLYVEIQGRYDVKAIYYHTLKEDENGEFYIDTINFTDTLFLDLIKGYFLSALGRNRRAFTLNDLPLTTDADQLVQEGEELIRDTTQNLLENNLEFYKAWR